MHYPVLELHFSRPEANIPLALAADRIGGALSHRSWTLSGKGRPGRAPAEAACCHLFLLTHGEATLTRDLDPLLGIAAPAMLWLPQAASGTLRVMAGGEGYHAAIHAEFLQRAVGDPALTVHLRPLLNQVVLAGPDRLAAELAPLAAAFEALSEEARGERPAAAAMAALQVAMLLLHLWRCAGDPLASGRRGAGADTAERFRLLIELHYREGLRIEDFASRLGVTRAHLHDACLRATGRTPLALLHDRLLAEARVRLEQTNLSVEQVGYGLGFRDPGYFNRFFKRLAGDSPGAYRRIIAAARAPAAATSFAAWP